MEYSVMATACQGFLVIIIDVKDAFVQLSSFFNAFS